MKKEKIKLIAFTSLLFFIIVMFALDDNFQRNIKWDFFNFQAFSNKNQSTIDSVFYQFSEEEINNAKISRDNFQDGMVAKDDIPSLISLNFDSATSTQFSNEEKIIGVYIDGEARAYPYSILYWHEIVNDTIANTPIAITLCPLCNTSAVFSRVINGKTTSFGVSGKLFNSCLVMHDRQTNSLWSQVWGLGVMGEQNNYELEKIISYTTTLGAWKKIHSNTLVLSTETGHARNYNAYPYGNYLISSELRFSARNQSELNINPKDTIYIISKNNQTQTEQNTFEGNSWQITKKELMKKNSLNFSFEENNYTVKWDKSLETARFYNELGKEVPSISAFAFVYPAYFIDTSK